MAVMTYLPTFFVKQKLAMRTNRYEIIAPTPDGTSGVPVAVAQQKRLALKEEVTFFTDETRTQRVFSFKARRMMDLNAGYDIFDDQQQQIGFFRKDFGASLLRSTFHIEGPGFAGRGQERSEVVALVRRFMDIPFLPIHFDFVASDGHPLIAVERQMTVWDRYTVHVPDPRVDFRIAAAVAVAMDALMAR
jgi:uncharacterized protein YxjI